MKYGDSGSSASEGRLCAPRLVDASSLEGEFRLVRLFRGVAVQFPKVEVLFGRFPMVLSHRRGRAAQPR